MTYGARSVSLRQRLRRDTRAIHDEVDRAFGADDIGTARGYARFLRAHHAAMTAIGGADGGDRNTSLAAEVGAIRRLIAADLAALGEPAGDAAARPALVFHGVALEYVLLGARLGLAVLRKRWLGDADPSLHGIRAFLSLPAETGRWTSLCRNLEQMPAEGREADAIVTDATALFALFAEAARHADHRTLGGNDGEDAIAQAG